MFNAVNAVNAVMQLHVAVSNVRMPPEADLRKFFRLVDVQVVGLFVVPFKVQQGVHDGDYSIDWRGVIVAQQPVDVEPVAKWLTQWMDELGQHHRAQLVDGGEGYPSEQYVAELRAMEGHAGAHSVRGSAEEVRQGGGRANGHGENDDLIEMRRRILEI